MDKIHLSCYQQFLFNILSRSEKEKLIKDSCLDNRERDAMLLRYVVGKTVKESAALLEIGYEAFKKLQARCFKKLYLWIELRPENCVYKNMVYKAISINNSE